MGRSLLSAGESPRVIVRRSPRRPSGYPLQWRLLPAGIALGATVALVAQSLVLGFAVFTLLALTAVLWRRDEAPILVFCLGYQWLFVVTGYAYQLITRDYPGFLLLGDLDTAVMLSLVGLITVAVSLRAALDVSGRFQVASPAEMRYDLLRCFWWVIAVYALSWSINIAPTALWFEGAQILSSLLAFRAFFLAVLLFEVLRQGRGYLLAALAIVFTIIPETLTGMSRFSGPIFVAAVAVLGQWRPWAASPADRIRSRRMLWLASALGCILIVLALGWQGAVKAPWRLALVSEQVTGSRLGQVAAFGSYAAEALQDFDLSNGMASLVQRMGSGVAFFSHVLQRVPAIVPHQDGELIQRAIEHVFFPRVLFPDKRDLGSDSWLISTFAGVVVAGEESNTSIGLGYIAEFYIDFGIPLMFLGIAAFGLLVGLCYRILMLFSPSKTFFHAAACVVFLNHFMNYEAEIAKMTGGLLTSVVVTAVILWVTGVTLSAFMGRRPPLIRRRHPLAAVARTDAAGARE